MKKVAVITMSFFILIAFGSKSVYSQSKIFGSATDAGGKPLEHANVLLLKTADSSLVKGMVTNEKGQYFFEKTPVGKYLISYTYAGFKQIYSKAVVIRENQKETNLGNIRLEGEKLKLKDVTVTTKKQLFEQKPDRLVVNVAGSITSAGSTALDVLERSPGVVVDRQNNSLSVNGKNGVVVMINGKINYMPLSGLVQMLAGMSADNIEKIEIITTPPANFDAEGNAGFINILLKSNPNYGTNGSFSLSAGYGNKETSSADITVNHRKGKINLYGSYSFTHTHQLQLWDVYRKINYGGKTTETNSTSNRDPIRNVHNARFGIDYQLSKKTVLGAIFAAYDNVWKMNARNDVTVTIDQKLDTLLRIKNDEINHWKNVMGNLNIQHTINPEVKITADVDYVYYGDNNPNSYFNSYYNSNGILLFDENTKSTKLTPINIFAGKVDFTGKIGKKVDVETGVKVSNSRFTNDVGVAKFLDNTWKYEDSLTAKFKLKETIAAAYTSFNLVVNDKTTVKAGLRYEHTTSNLGTDTKKNIVDRRYGRWFPTLFLSRKLNDTHSFNLSYNRRITRPTFNDLAPFVIFLDPTTFISGNPALQPSISDALKGDYLYKNFIFSLTYTYAKDPIASFQSKVDPKTNKQYVSAENLNYQKTLNISFSLPFSLTKWWNMQNNLAGEWQQINVLYNNAPITVEQKNFQIFSSQNFKLPKDFSIELSGFYRSGGLFGRSIFKSIYTVNCGIQKKISEKAGSLRFGVDNIFNSLKFKANQNYPEHNLISQANLVFANRNFKLTYTCKFGNSVLKSQRNRTTGSEEERGRVQ